MPDSVRAVARQTAAGALHVTAALPRPAYRPAEVAAMLGVARATIYAWLRAGLIDSVLVNPRVRLIPASEVDRLLQRNAEPGRNKRSELAS